MLSVPAVSAQTVGTFRWQLQPFCNVVTLSVRQDGGVYTLDGYDDQCGGGERASVVGTAFLNPDGSVGMGLSSMTAPEAAPVVLRARIELATVSGTWSDSAGNSGAFVFTPGASAGGVLRPVPPNGVRAGSLSGAQLAPGSVGAEQIAVGAVEGSHLGPGAIASALGPISSGQIAARAITATHLAAGTVGAEHLATGAIGAAELGPGAVETVHLAPGAVGAALGPIASEQIAPGAILSVHLGPGAVTATHLAPGAVGPTAIATGAIGVSHLAPGAVGAAQIAEGAVGASHLAPGLVQSIVGTCPPGRYLRGVAPGGTGICEPVFVPTLSTNVANLPRVLWTSTAVDADSIPVIAAFDIATSALRVTKCLNRSCAGDNVSTLADGAGISAGDHPAVAIGRDGLPVISHGDFTVGALRVTKCGNAACSSGNVSTLADHPGEPGGANSKIAIGADGLPIISHTGVSGLRVTKCGDAACSADNVSTFASDVPTDGFQPSIAIGADGLPVISHRGAVGGFAALRVTKCGNPACSAGNVTTTVDDARPFQVGESSTIAIGADGLPVISYVEITRSRLRLAKCGDPACSAGNTIAVVDEVNGQSGRYMSMVLGVDGLPIVSVQRPFDGTLRVVKCGTPACTAGNVSTAVDGGLRLVGFWNQVAVGRDGVPVIGHVNLDGVVRVTKCGTQSCR